MCIALPSEPSADSFNISEIVGCGWTKSPISLEEPSSNFNIPISPNNSDTLDPIRCAPNSSPISESKIPIY